MKTLRVPDRRKPGRPPNADPATVREPVPLRLPRAWLALIDAKRAQDIAGGAPVQTRAQWIERAVAAALGA